MALGAQPRQVSWLILRGGLGQLAIGLTLGLLGAWSVTSVLQSLLVQTAATDPLTFAAIARAALVRHAGRLPHPCPPRHPPRSTQGAQSKLTPGPSLTGLPSAVP